MIRRLLRAALSRRWVIPTAWLTAGMLLHLASGLRSEGPAAPMQFLPADSPSQRAMEALQEHFPDIAGKSQVVLVAHRPDRPDTPAVESLTPADLDWLGRAGDRILLRQTQDETHPFDTDSLSVLSPVRTTALRDALIAPPRRDHGQAGLLIVQTAGGFISTHASDTVDHVRRVLQSTPAPEGLQVYLTGTAGFGHDYALAAERSHERTLGLTLAMVVIILLLVYRAPLAAAVPLLAVSMAAWTASSLMAFCMAWGLHMGAGERIFLYVLLYGAGIDYSMFFLGRFREQIRHAPTSIHAAVSAWVATAPAVAASAGTTIAGLSMLTLARFSVFRNVGPAAAVALMVALLASLTLVPALATLLGRALFWPRGPHRLADSSIWRRISAGVASRPGLTFTLACLALAAPAMRGLSARWVYNSLADLDESYPAVAGAHVVTTFWPKGELAPLTLVVQPDGPTTLEELRTWSRVLSDRLVTVPEVANVRSLVHPVGLENWPQAPEEPGDASLPWRVDLPTWRDRARHTALAMALQEMYVRDGALRMEIILAQDPFSNRSLDLIGQIRELAGTTLAQASIDAGEPTVLLAGAPAEMAEVRILMGEDFIRVAAAALAVIALIILLFLRDVLLSLMMVASTVLGYLAALGATWWVFTVLLGAEGIDWKVQVFLFVVMVAVGQDYNIFLMTRVAQEGRSAPPREAVERAVAATGGIISSCGLIMAGTLGSLMIGDLGLMRQLGFAFAAGMLIDTFVVRPMVVPAAAILLRRTGRSLLPPDETPPEDLQATTAETPISLIGSTIETSA